MMFSRLFNLYSKKDKQESSQNWKNTLEEYQADQCLPQLVADKIRVVVFRECEKKADKTLLFDSDAIVLNEAGLTDGICRSIDSSISGSPPKYKRIKPSSDKKVLGEMIFGSVSMVYKGSIQKVHLMRTPPQLLMTKVFALRSRSAGVNFCDNEMIAPSLTATSSVTSLNIPTGGQLPKRRNGKHHMRSLSNPVIRSNLRKNSAMSSWSLQSTDSCFNQSFSGRSSANGGGSPSGSLQSRYMRSVMTSMDSTEILRSKSDQSEENRTAYKLQPKIGLGVIFKLWEDDEESNRLFQDFFFTHYTIFEAHLQAFRVKIEKSFYLRKNFVDVVLKAVEIFKHQILTLCYSPRIVEPVWLNLMVLKEQKHNATVDKFMSSFINLVKKCEIKQNNYFLSILLTAVLTYHPSWVTTVMPSANNAKRSYLDKHSSSSLDMLAKSHPYNPLWAQLCDMYGSVNSPRKLARTIIVGENAGLVVELLYLLTYFLRCSNISENKLQTVEPCEHEQAYRFSGSSWNETMFGAADENGTPNSVRSWIDQVSCVDSNEFVKATTGSLGTEEDDVFTKTDSIDTDDTITCSTYKDNLLLNDSMSSSLSNTHESTNHHSQYYEDDVMVETRPIDFSRCYCGYLQKLDSSLGRKNLRNLIKSTDREHLVNLLGGRRNSNTLKSSGSTNINNGSGNGGTNNSGPHNLKSCKGCRTLEKTIYEEYCDKCKEILNNLSLEIDSVCKYCLNHLEKLREMIDTDGNIVHTTDAGVSSTSSTSSSLYKNLLDGTGETVVVPACERVSTPISDKSDKRRSKRDMLCRKKLTASSSSKKPVHCYCGSSASSAASGKQTLSVPHTPCNTHTDIESIEEFIPRERKASDPVDCVPSPKLTTKCILRHSTTSHDSGTEMACSVSSSCQELDSGESLNLTRDNSLSSHDNLFSSDTIVGGGESGSGDMDSDYCSVDNDQTSTISEVTCYSDQLINTVCKSSSSTTIREIYVNLDSNPLSSSKQQQTYINDSTTTTINASHVFNSQRNVLDMELDGMNLREVPLPRIVPTPVNDTKSEKEDTSRKASFGNSLFGGYCDSYVSDFVLHGTEKLDEEKLATDLQNSIKHSVLDEQVYDATCIVADTDNWSCEVWNFARRTDSIDRNTCESLSRKPVFASSLVSTMVESTKELWDIDMPSKYCLRHLEEQLKDIYHRSKVLGEYAFNNTKEDTSAFTRSLSYRSNDVELLKAVCVAHSPHFDGYLY